MNPPRDRLGIWLRELRAPNLLTVPGDPLVGALIAAAERGQTASPPWAVMGTALALYMAGILDNDLTGLDEDRRAGRRRPLVTGELSVATARRARATFFAIGLALSALAGSATALTAAVLAALILVYHRTGPHAKVVGPLLLGLCRACSLSMGALSTAATFPGPHTITAASLWAILITLLSIAARHETSIPGRPELVGRLLCAWPLVQAIGALWSAQSTTPLVAMSLLLASLLATKLRRRWPPS